MENDIPQTDEDETDTCSLQYQEVDASLLGTAVFIKNVQIEIDYPVLLYVHSPILEDQKKQQIKFQMLLTALTIILAVSSIITILSFP